MFRNTDFAQYFEQRQWYVHTKMQQTFIENNFTIEEINYNQTHIPVASSL